MDTVRITFHHRDGRTKYIENTKDLIAIIGCIPKDVKWISNASPATMSKTYFRLLDELVKNTNTGNSKASLHDALKPMILNKLKEFNDYFAPNSDRTSTTSLTHDGWVQYIEEFKIFANDIFGYIFIKP